MNAISQLIEEKLIERTVQLQESLKIYHEYEQPSTNAFIKVLRGSIHILSEIERFIDEYKN